MAPWRKRLHDIIYEAETPAGKAFDVALLSCILISIAAVLMESVHSVEARAGAFLRAAEWVLTGLFTVEYGLRLITVRHPLRYAFSFFGLIDLLAIFPTYLSLLIPGTQSLLVIRALRLLRVFRVFKLGRYVGQATQLRTALVASREKIIVFLGTVLTAVIIVGALMYLIEGEEAGFTSIPRSIYWAIVTMTTVGYGDITPQTVLGQTIAAAVMIMGYGIIAVPTGIVSAELAQVARMPVSTRACPDCSVEGHDPDALFCKHCGAPMEPDQV